MYLMTAETTVIPMVMCVHYRRGQPELELHDRVSAPLFIIIINLRLRCRCPRRSATNGRVMYITISLGVHEFYYESVGRKKTEGKHLNVCTYICIMHIN